MFPSPDAKNQSANQAATKKRKRNRCRTWKQKQDRMALAAEKRNADDEFKKKIDSTITTNIKQESLFPDITLYHNEFPDLFDANIRRSSHKFATNVKEARRRLPVHSHHKEDEQTIDRSQDLNWTNSFDCSFLMHEANVVVGTSISNSFQSSSKISSSGTLALFKDCSYSCNEGTDDQIDARVTVHESSLVEKPDFAAVIEWQKFLAITIAMVQSKEFSAPLHPRLHSY